MSLHTLIRAISTTPFNNYDLAASTGKAESTIRRYRRILAEKALTWTQLESLTDDELYLALNQPRRGRPLGHMPDLDAVVAELEATGMSLQTWYWRTYGTSTEKVISYSHLASKLKHRRKALKLTMRQHHTPGERVFVDFSGKRPSYLDPVTGERTYAELFVGVLGGSSLLYATAIPSQKVPDFIAAHVSMFDYFGGVPQAIVPDNLKSAVIKPGRDAVIQRSFADMAAHYDALVIPTRPRRPQDKGKVEVGVKVAQDRILAPLRGRTFSSLTELNAAIAELVDALNDRPMRLGPSRREQFETFERAALRPLPAAPYVYAEWQTVETVAKDYHVPVYGHFYSVPHTMAAQRLDIRITTDTVTFFHGRTEVARHPRNDEARKSTARLSHMPENHRLQAERSPDMIRAWAADAGPNIIRFVTEQLDQEHAVRGLKPCETLRDLAEEYGLADVDQAVGDAFQRGVVNVTSVRRALSARQEAAGTGPTASTRSVRRSRKSDHVA